MLYAAIMELPDIKCLETNRLKIVQQTEESGKHRILIDILEVERFAGLSVLAYFMS